MKKILLGRRQRAVLELRKMKPKPWALIEMEFTNDLRAIAEKMRAKPQLRVTLKRE